ncbi:MAG: hypothetical protein LC127_15105 [Chitinophagales bacterium]|nr:hypothetical protein [Chitinophagales bacterium]
MLIYPKDIKEKLEYNKVIDFISSECLTEMAKGYFQDLEILDDLGRIVQLIEETEGTERHWKEVKIFL